MKAKSVVTFAGFVAFLGAVLPARSESGLAEVTLVRGVVENISGDTLTVKSPSGLVNVHIERPLQIYRDAPSDPAHVNASSFVGITSIKQPDGSESAKEIHIFPEELRGTGEGSYPWDQDQSKPVGNSRMTNGTVSQSRMTNGTVNARSDASTLTVQYGGGVQTISIPPDVPVTALTLSTEPLKPGQNAVVLAKQQQDGSLSANRIISRGNASSK